MCKAVTELATDWSLFISTGANRCFPSKTVLVDPKVLSANLTPLPADLQAKKRRRGGSQGRAAPDPEGVDRRSPARRRNTQLGRPPK